MLLNILVPCDTRDYLYHGKTLIQNEKEKIKRVFCKTVLSISPSLWMTHEQIFYARVKSDFPELSAPEMTLLWTIQNLIRLVFINNYQSDIRIIDVKVLEIPGCISIKIGDTMPQQTGILP